MSLAESKTRSGVNFNESGKIAEDEEDLTSSSAQIAVGIIEILPLSDDIEKGRIPNPTRNKVPEAVDEPKPNSVPGNAEGASKFYGEKKAVYPGRLGIPPINDGTRTA